MLGISEYSSSYKQASSASIPAVDIPPSFQIAVVTTGTASGLISLF